MSDLCVKLHGDFITLFLSIEQMLVVLLDCHQAILPLEGDLLSRGSNFHGNNFLRLVLTIRTTLINGKSDGSICLDRGSISSPGTQIHTLTRIQLHDRTQHLTSITTVTVFFLDLQAVDIIIGQLNRHGANNDTINFVIITDLVTIIRRRNQFFHIYHFLSSHILHKYYIIFFYKNQKSLLSPGGFYYRLGK